MSQPLDYNNHPAIASLSEMVKLRYGARELTGFPRVQARQMMAGGHRSRFRGRGMDFDEVRIYQPGDDVRSQTRCFVVRLAAKSFGLRKAQSNRLLPRWSHGVTDKQVFCFDPVGQQRDVFSAVKMVVGHSFHIHREFSHMADKRHGRGEAFSVFEQGFCHGVP